MKIYKSILLFVALSFVHANGELGFLYGVLGKRADNPNVIVSYDDRSVVLENDQIKLNIAYKTGTNFYAIYYGSDRSFDVLYNSYDQKISNKDTTSVAVLKWAEFTGSKGEETIYLLNLKDGDLDFNRLIKKYKRSKSKLRKKYAKKIVKILEEMNNPTKKNVRFKSRMEKPITVGAVFRGDDDLQYNSYSLTHQEKGEGVAIKKVVLIHE
ncbi:MAG: hypothetical protein CBD58_04560 [bacterium TMED198]|nr:MAG: hypothetical protein CBD58_04560 [bacterium TMED198]|tara:strand:+ start:3386 stop:4018 length:633 start_codon:yes stop_codon:yes gene_type:complete